MSGFEAGHATSRARSAARSGSGWYAILARSGLLVAKGI